MPSTSWLRHYHNLGIVLNIRVEGSVSCFFHGRFWKPVLKKHPFNSSSIFSFEIDIEKVMQYRKLKDLYPSVHNFSQIFSNLLMSLHNTPLSLLYLFGACDATYETDSESVSFFWGAWEFLKVPRTLSSSSSSSLSYVYLSAGQISPVWPAIQQPTSSIMRVISCNYDDVLL